MANNQINHVPAADVREAEAAALGRQFERLYDTDVLINTDDDVAAVVSVPAGRTLVSTKKLLDEFRDKPERRTGTARLADVESFLKLVERNASGDSVIFANPAKSGPSLTAVFDYHPASTDAKDADWLKHRAVYAPELSEEWKTWLALDGKLLPQADFAAFIEDRIGDIIVPFLDDPKLKTLGELLQGKWAEPSQLVALSRGLQVNVDVAIAQAVTLNTGEIAVRYEETHRDGEGQPISIPNLFQICIPVFYAGTGYRIPVRLRYRMVGRNMQWMYQLIRPDLSIADAFDGIVAEVRKESSVPVLIGTPES